VVWIVSRAQGQATAASLEGSAERIRHFLADRFLFDASASIDPKASLIDTGILDSTGAMELVFFLEEEFRIEVADGDLVPDNLDSIERIVAYVKRRSAIAS
jgi:acyl carrier protein